jgi:hypothetical protein
MSPIEVAARTGSATRKLGWRSSFRHYPDDVEIWAQGDANQLHCHTISLSRHEIDASSAACAATIDCAEQLLAGRWHIFDLETAQLGANPDWFRDPRTGRAAPADAYCFDIPYRDSKKVGDVKYIWELSRHNHLTLLAAAYFLTDDPRYAERVCLHLRSWWQENPFLRGINWTSGIEAGLRLIAWVWIRRLLGNWPFVGSVFEDSAMFRRQLFDHQRYLRALQSHGSSANNHLIAEAVGLFAAAAAFPLFRRSIAWRDHGAKLLEREAVCQTFPDGVTRELAFEYHGFVIELLLVAGVEADIAGCPLSDAYWERIRAMVDAVAATVDIRSNPPRQGDGDASTALLVDAPEWPRWHSLLATGAALFGAPTWWPQYQVGDVRTALLSCRASRRPQLGLRHAKRQSLLRDSGIVILRDVTARPDEIWCRCDCGPHGFLSIAAHAHADALAVEVRHGGVEILADPGTYSFYCDPAWRRYFRSTISHNTVEVDDQSQAVDGGRFLWLTRPKAHLVRATGLDSGPTAECAAYHDGYERLRPPAIHHRSVRLDRMARCVHIIDRIETRQARQIRIAFHIGPDVACRLTGDKALLSWRAAETEFAGEICLAPELAWVSLCGQKDPPMGWYSRSFGYIRPSTVLLGSGWYDPGSLLMTRLCIEQRAAGALEMHWRRPGR